MPGPRAGASQNAETYNRGTYPEVLADCDHFRSARNDEQDLVLETLLLQ